MLRKALSKLNYLFVILSIIGLFVVFPVSLYLQGKKNDKIDLSKKETVATVIRKTSRKWRMVKFEIEDNWHEKKVKVGGGDKYLVGETILMEYDSLDHDNFRFVWKN